VEVAGPSPGEAATAGATPQGREQESTGLSGDELQSNDLQNAAGAEEAAESLIVCRGGKVCRGAWTWRGGVRVCSGGFYCRSGALLLLAESSDAGDQEEDEAAAAPALADFMESGSEQESEAMNSSELMELLTNSSEAAESLIVCRGGRVCRGAWTWRGGVRVCSGGFYCRSR
jgi:hypothetical protein